MKIRFFLRPKWAGATIVVLSHKGFHAASGAVPDQFGGFSGTPSRLLVFPTQSLIAFGTRSRLRLGQRICRTPEEWKVWSQNLGHESEATTFVGYGQVPAHRHAEIMRGFNEGRPDFLPAGLDFASLKAFVQSVEAVSSS